MSQSWFLCFYVKYYFKKLDSMYIQWNYRKNIFQM